MRTIGDIYGEYHTMPNLQLHQLRVAAVAMQICDNFNVELNRKDLAIGCMLHDIGNIVKFRLRAFPELLEGEDVEYWENIQKQYIEKYGPEEHEANMGVAGDIGVSKDILGIVDAVGFHNWCLAKDEGSWEHKIASYADSRVAPFGVKSLEERLMDANKRYADTSHTTDSDRDMLYDCIREVEKELFSHLRINPEDITDESIEKYFEELKKIEF
ncbi:MAG: HD domain-containing protein [Candidatus Paceibacterota bacterium]